MMHWSRCKNCLSSLSEDHSRGTLVCTECGLVNEIDIGYSHDTQLEHTVSNQYTNFNNTKNSFKLKWVQHVDAKITWNHKNHTHFTQLCQGHFPEAVVDEANQLFTELCKRKLYRGSIRIGMIACSLMWACKLQNVPRTVQEISNITGTTTKIIHKSKKLFQNVLHNVVAGKDTQLTHKDITRRFCSEIQLETSEHKKLVRAVSELMDRNHPFFDGKKTTSIVGVAILFVLSHMNSTISKKQLSIQFTVSLVTINKLLKELTTFYSKNKLPQGIENLHV